MSDRNRLTLLVESRHEAAGDPTPHTAALALACFLASACAKPEQTPAIPALESAAAAAGRIWGPLREAPVDASVHSV